MLQQKQTQINYKSVHLYHSVLLSLNSPYKRLPSWPSLALYNRLFREQLLRRISFHAARNIQILLRCFHKSRYLQCVLECPLYIKFCRWSIILSSWPMWCLSSACHWAFLYTVNPLEKRCNVNIASQPKVNEFVKTLCYQCSMIEQFLRLWYKRIAKDQRWLLYYRGSQEYLFLWNLNNIMKKRISPFPQTVKWCTPICFNLLIHWVYCISL